MPTYMSNGIPSTQTYWPDANLTMTLEKQIEIYLKDLGAGFVRFVDLSHLAPKQNKGLPCAVVFGLVLSPGYIREVADTPDYVARRVENDYDFDDDEYYLNELKTGELSDKLFGFLEEKGFRAHSLSDENQAKQGDYDASLQATPLPHKTIALLAGLGWIGRHNLLVTDKYGSGVNIGAVLTNALLSAHSYEPPFPKCGKCRQCVDVCQPGAIKGILWGKDVARDDIIDVEKCTTCLKCLVFCPWTQAYMKKASGF